MRRFLLELLLLFVFCPVAGGCEPPFPAPLTGVVPSLPRIDREGYNIGTPSAIIGPISISTVTGPSGVSKTCVCTGSSAPRTSSAVGNLGGRVPLGLSLDDVLFDEGLEVELVFCLPRPPAPRSDLSRRDSSRDISLGVLRESRC